MTVAERFASNLLVARKRAGLSQEEVGFRAELHRTEIGMLERAERIPRLDTLARVAGAVGVDTCELTKGIVWTPSSREVGRYDVSDA